MMAMINQQNATGETPLDLAIKENLLQTTSLMKQMLSNKASLLLASIGVQNATASYRETV
jgi:ankyrin repeat protein